MDRIRRIVSRDVTREECSSLDEDVPAGSVVYLYGGYTYSCISRTGMAVTKEPDKTPFFELPKDALARIDGKAEPTDPDAM